MSRTDDLLAKAKLLLPSNFVCNTSDAKLLAYLDLTLQDINATTPWTGYTLENMPVGWDAIVCFGADVYATMFLSANYALQDFNYSDNGLSLNIDRSARLTPVYERQLKAFEHMKHNLKKAEAWKVGPYGLGTPRFQSQVGQFLKILFGNTWR